MIELFREWLKRDRDEETVTRYLRYAERMRLEECKCSYECLFERALRANTKWEKKTLRLWAKLCWQMRRLSLDDLQALREATPLPKQPTAPPPHVQLSLSDIDSIRSKSLRALSELSLIHI